jgi:N-acetylmuramoyl-L-alanine amidase
VWDHPVDVAAQRRPAVATLAVAIVLALGMQSGSARPAASDVVRARGHTAPGPPSRRTTPDAPKPPITWKRIPFGAKRRHQMAAYSRRHYGTATWRLSDPRVVVEHFTGGTSFSAAWNTFASDARHLGELPGTCAHFIIDTDGTIYQLVPLWIRCRHAMGMNWVSFGIEHVGTSDADVMGNTHEIASSYALTLWLVQRYHVQVRNVIGHSESLISPYHVEHVAKYRCQTHSDFSHARMRTYRTHLRKLAKRHHVPIGPPPAWVDSGC